MPNNQGYKDSESLKKRLLFLKSITILIILQILFAKLSLDNIFPYINYVDEIISSFGLLFIIFYFSEFNKSIDFRRLILFYSGFLGIGILSNIYWTTPFEPAFLQIFLDTKFISIILLFNILCRNIDIGSWIITLFKVVLIINIPLILFQFYNPGLYDSIFSASGTAGMILIGKSYTIRAVGIFWHPSQLATFTSFAIYIFYMKKGFKTWLILSTIQLILTFQRQEIFTIFLCIYLMSLWYPSSGSKEFNSFKRVFTTFLIFIGSYLFFILFSESLSIYSNQSSLLDTDETRLVFYIKSFLLSSSSFPLGTGFGTFGGYAAFIYESPLYQSLGFDRYYWYEAGNFMLDTYYPHIIAESGVFGTICYLFSLFFLYKYLYKTSFNPLIRKTYTFVFLLLVINTLTTPVINDALTIILSSLIPFIFQDEVNAKKKIVYNEKLKLVQ